MKTINEVLNDYKKRHDFNKPLGTIAHGIACSKLAEHFENPKLKFDLKGCSNLTQFQNILAQKTDALTQERTPEEIQKFKSNFERLLKMARL
jgi:hypothetical protein